MSTAWRRCDTCRKVKTTSDFGGGEPTCLDCATKAARPAAARVEVRTGAPRVAPTGAAGRAPGRATAVGGRSAHGPAAEPAPPDLLSRLRGDPEVRQRRARETAMRALAERYPEDYSELLEAARRGEGLGGA